MRRPVRLRPATEYVAFWLLGMSTPLEVEDRVIAADLGLKPQTVYRALEELENAGALTFTRTDRSLRPRTVTLLPHPWIWAQARAMREQVQVS